MRLLGHCRFDPMHPSLSAVVDIVVSSGPQAITNSFTGLLGHGFENRHHLRKETIYDSHGDPIRRNLSLVLNPAWNFSC